MLNLPSILEVAESLSSAHAFNKKKVCKKLKLREKVGF